MSARAKILTGFCSLWPAAVVLYVFFGPREHYATSVSLGIAITLAVVVIFAYLVSTSYLAVPRRKGLWVAMLVLGNVVVLPLFWYLYIYSSPLFAEGQQSQPANPE